MVIDYGVITVAPEWQVCEDSAVGFSRFYYITSGEVWYEDEYGVRHLKPGNAYFFPSTIPYKISHNPSNPMNCLFFHVVMPANTINRLIEIEVKSDSFLSSLLSAMKYAVIDGNGVIFNELSEVLELYCSQNNIIVKTLPESIEKALFYISEHFRAEITLAKLSGIAGYSKEYFMRQFKEHFGVPPYQYIKNIRLNEATKLLKKNIPISEAAAQAGYPDIKNFTRAFKSKYGMTAGEWKRRHKSLP